MYLTLPLERLWVIDIEGDPIPTTKIYCAVMTNVGTGETLSYRPNDLNTLKNALGSLLSRGDRLIGHNILGYDAPTLNRLLGTSIGVSQVIDTMLMSMVWNPSLPGFVNPKTKKLEQHSLWSWGIRLKLSKIDFEDFETGFSEEMLTYCERDVALTVKVYKALRKRMNDYGFTDMGLEIEHRAWALKERQQQNGFAFNIEEANLLYIKLREMETEIREKAYEYWPPELRMVAEFQRPYKKDGSPTANYLRHLAQYERLEVREDGGGYRAYGHVYFDLGSPQQRVEKLLELGWKPGPREVTKTGAPQPTKKGKLAPSLERFVEDSGNEQVRLIVQWMNLNYLGNMVNTWIEAFNGNTGCIHGRLLLADTLRYRHSNPNTANIPAVRLDKDDHPLMGKAGGYTYEARGLWTVRDPATRRLVGVDAKGIQLRILAHYLNNPTFTAAILSSDPHAANQASMGLPTRALTKTIN